MNNVVQCRQLSQGKSKAIDVQGVRCCLHRADERGCVVTAASQINVYVLVKAALHISPIASENVFTFVVTAKQTAHRETFMRVVHGVS